MSTIRTVVSPDVVVDFGHSLANMFVGLVANMFGLSFEFFALFLFVARLGKLVFREVFAFTVAIWHDFPQAQEDHEKTFVARHRRSRPTFQG